MKKRILLFILLIVLLYAGGGIAYFMQNKKPEVITVSNVDTIKGYNYVLKSNDTLLYKDEFKLLKENLESETIDYEEYAKSIAKLFIIDVYNINNKINKYDVGGALFVYPEFVSNYKLNIQNTIYKYIEDNSNKNRKQVLPEVSGINIESCEEVTYKIDKTEYNGYKISLKWDYVEDLGYDQEGEVILTKVNNTYYVVEKN